MRDARPLDEDCTISEVAPMDEISLLLKELEQYKNSYPSCREIEPVSLADITVSVSPGMFKQVILRSETSIELGGPNTVSSSFALASNERIHADRIFVIGDDLRSLKRRAAVPFGLVLSIYGKNLNAKDCEQVQDVLHVNDWIEGYMVRIRPESVWGRVSKKALKKGFGFRDLGSALIYIARQRIKGIEGAEVLFVTSNTSDVQKLDEIGCRCRSTVKEIRRATWAEKGIDIDCPLGGHCGACQEKEVCRNVRDIAQKRTRQLTKDIAHKG